MDMLPGTVMTCTIPFMESGSAIGGIQITPLTSIANQMATNMFGGMTESNVTESHQAVGDFFDVTDILYTAPMDATLNGSGSTVDLDMMNYGMSLAAMPEYASMQGVTNSSDFINSWYFSSEMKFNSNSKKTNVSLIFTENSSNVEALIDQLV